MNIQQFLEHHGIVRNPFSEEDAQVDPVFKDHCIDSAFHPVWDKVCGDPREPSTSIVFGPKGAGKTAIRLQIQRKVEQYNRDHIDRRVYVIRYDDFNPFIAKFQDRLGARRRRSPEKTLAQWKLWDHMDAILCLAVTNLVDQILRSDAPGDASSSLSKEDVDKLSHSESRDLLLLALAYDQSIEGVVTDRWKELRKRLRYKDLLHGIDVVIACLLGVAAVILAGALFQSGTKLTTLMWLTPLLIFLGSLPFLWRWWQSHWLAMGMHRHMRVGNREIGTLRRMLLKIPQKELASQPLPRHDRTDDRYGSLTKLQSLLRTLRFDGMLVLVDRVDEPQIIEGRVDRMKSFVWPMLDNKLLKHPGLGLKMMLPRELHREVEREDRSFHERARLDKQNVVTDFNWTGQALYDIVSSRMRACAAPNSKPEPTCLFDPAICAERLISAFESLRVPRHLFRCLYRMLVEHCNLYTDAEAKFRIRPETFEKVLAVYMRDLDGI